MLKKRVLHVSAGGLGHGGVSTVIFNIVGSLYEKFDFSCVVFSRNREREDDFKHYGKVYRLNCYPKNGKRNYFELITRPLKLYFGIKRLCKNNVFDIIHCHNQRDAWICLLAAKHAGVSIRIAHSHNTNSPKKKNAFEKIYKKVSTFMINKTANCFVGCSKAACEDLFQNDAFFVVPNAVNLQVVEEFKHCRDNGLRFIHVGRYTYQKNQEFVIQTFSEICKRYPDSYMYLVGFGENSEIARLNDMIDDFGLRNNVEMVPGDKVNVYDYYEKTKYMIFPSRFEGFGIVLLEAQAMGIHCYVSEHIQGEVDVGLLTFMELRDGPKRWVEKFLNDLEHGCSKRINTEKLSHYSIDSISKQYENIYNGNLLNL